MRPSPHDALPHLFVEPTASVGTSAGHTVLSRRGMLQVSLAGLLSMSVTTQVHGEEPAVAEVPTQVEENPVNAELPIDHMVFDEKKELKGEPLARFIKSPEYIGYREMIKRSIGLLNTASFDRATEHRRIQGAIIQLLNVINPLPKEIHELFDRKTRGDVPRLRDGSMHNFPLEWHTRMDGLERFLQEQVAKTPVRLPPGKVSVSLAISEYQKQTGYRLSFVNERIVFGLPKEIVIRPGANNHLNVLMSIIDIRYTLSFGNDPRLLKIKDARPGDPALIGSGDIVGLMEEGKGIELRSAPSKGNLVIPDMHQTFRGGHVYAVHGFRHPRKPEHLKTHAEKEKEKELRDCATAVNDENPPPYITDSVEFITGSLRRTQGSATVECSFDRTSAVGRQEVLLEKEQAADGWRIRIKSETSVFKDREHLDYGWRLAASEQSTYRVRVASGRILLLKPDYAETSQATVTLHASTKEEPMSIIVDASEDVSPECKYKIPARSLESSNKPL